MCIWLTSTRKISQGTCLYVKCAFGKRILPFPRLRLRFFFFKRVSVWLWCFQWVSYTIYETHKFLFSATFSLKMGLIVLFTHLKIISVQCFQFQFSVSVKIRPKYSTTLTKRNIYKKTIYFLILKKKNIYI